MLYVAVILSLAGYIYFSSSAKIPGPLAAQFSSLWYLSRVWNGSFEWDNIELHRKYQSNIVQYAPGRYSVNDPSAIKTIYGQSSEFGKSRWYEAWNPPGLSTLFTEPKNSIHDRRRRLFAPSYSMSGMVTYEAYVDDCIKKFCKKVEEKADSKSVMDMAWWLSCFAADCIAMVTFTSRFGHLDRGEDVGQILATTRAKRTQNALMGIYAAWYPYFHSLSSYLQQYWLPADSPTAFIEKFTAESIVKRGKETEYAEDCLSTPLEPHEMDFFQGPKDFLTKFLDLKFQDPENFTESDVKIGLIQNVATGSDTVAGSLSAILYFLLKNPRTMNKLRLEIDKYCRDHGLPTREVISFKDSQQLPYLQAVIQEALRLHPITGLPFERAVPVGGAEICGHFFPEGTVVGANAWVLHYDTNVYGSDASIFRPERWIEADKHRWMEMQRQWVPFGMGSRTCIGKNIAMLEMCKVVPELVRRFDFDLGLELQGSKGWETVNHWFVLPKSLNVKIHRREGMNVATPHGVPNGYIKRKLPSLSLQTIIDE